MAALEQSYIIKDAPGKGKGMFASRAIKRGECVLSEEPLVFVGPNLMRTLFAIKTLSKHDKEVFFALQNVHPDLPKELGIARTNALPLGQDAIEAAIFAIISRINHDCAPNVRHSWNSNTGKEYVYAVQDISKGGEILTAYLDPFTIREDRLRLLQQKFKFDCRCRLCAAPSPEYDLVVKRINLYSDLILKCASSNPRKAIKFVREAVALVDKIGGAGKTRFYYDGYQISAMYSDYKLAQHWANLLLESYRMDEGEEGDQYERYLRYSRDPSSHERAGCAGHRILS
ncbi:hypothetical protein EDD11_005535 [Mortierella claussenii]|nr:hypothetical protein EDD11_005535 [Mortierella claussenii]